MLPRARHLPCLLALILALPCVLALPAAASGVNGAAPLVLNTAARAPRSLPDGTGYQDRIITEAFRRIGIQVQIITQPPERALINANEGAIDGDCWRVSGNEARYPNLVMVPEPVDEASIKVFTRDPDMRITGWADLKPYDVAFINGWKILEAKVTATRTLDRVKDIDALFVLLDKGRTDAALVDPVMGQAVVRRRGLTGIRILEPPLTRQDMYMYLHRRHADLVPRLTETLRQMKRDGTFQRLARAGLAESGQAEAGR